MTMLLDADEDIVIQKTEKHWGNIYSIPFIKRLYEKKSCKDHQLEDALGEVEEERHNMWQWGVDTLLIFLFGCTILFDKINKHIKLGWRNVIWDLWKIHEWSWDGMTLANLYYYIYDATSPTTGSLGRCVALFEVMFVFFMFVVYLIIICKYKCVCFHS